MSHGSSSKAKVSNTDHMEGLMKEISRLKTSLLAEAPTGMEGNSAGTPQTDTAAEAAIVRIESAEEVLSFEEAVGMSMAVHANTDDGAPAPQKPKVRSLVWRTAHKLTKRMHQLGSIPHIPTMFEHHSPRSSERELEGKPTLTQAAASVTKK
jgi:hypothetical protein